MLPFCLVLAFTLGVAIKFPDVAPIKVTVYVCRRLDPQSSLNVLGENSVQFYSFRRMACQFTLLIIPAVCLSMGGCPPQTGGGAVCGNGSVETGEQCDDGNTVSDDGCSSSCQTETGGSTCGDGTVGTGEQCDDGNTVSGDGCSATCQNEEPTPPADEDLDGVGDDIDACRGTLRDTQVNDQGCPDADGDSVADEDDDCSGTRPREDVDANGCAESQRDTDNDGIKDDLDVCDNIPAGENDADEDGCPDSVPGTPDDDEDGVPNDIDQCADTAPDVEVDPAGCAESQRDSDDDGLTDDVDDCPTQPGTVQNNGCPGGGGGAVCGNGAVEAGEQCDDSNTTNGDGCSSNCQLEASGIANDNCANPTAIGEGSQVYSNVGATTDGPAEPVDCTFFSRNDIRSALWYCYTPTCTGEAVISLCGSGYDTKMAVYTGCACPDPGPGDRPIACSDDDCGTGTDNTQSRVTINATAGQSYMVRAGGFFGNREQGEGRLTIRCGQDTCVNGTGDCMIAHGDAEPGCSTASCCTRVCEVDAFCCDVTWDAFCASQASGYCSATGFATCNAEAGACSAAHANAGCNDSECCNAVCETDPFCCITTWDENCVSQSDLICATCGRGRGDCFVARTAPGCDDVSCCAKVCAADEFCCNTEWDATCVQQAQDLCRR